MYGEERDTWEEIYYFCTQMWALYILCPMFQSAHPLDDSFLQLIVFSLNAWLKCPESEGSSMSPGGPRDVSLKGGASHTISHC